MYFKLLNFTLIFIFDPKNFNQKEYTSLFPYLYFCYFSIYLSKNLNLFFLLKLK